MTARDLLDHLEQEGELVIEEVEERVPVELQSQDVRGRDRAESKRVASDDPAESNRWPRGLPRPRTCPLRESRTPPRTREYAAAGDFTFT